MVCAYCSSSSSFFSSTHISAKTFLSSSIDNLPTRRPRVCSTPKYTTPIPNPHYNNIRVTPTCSMLSSYFPVPDPFALPTIAFLNSTASFDLRPELIGSVLWTIGLYLGFSQKTRWASIVYKSLLQTFTKIGFSSTVADTLAALLHTAPFLTLGFFVDAILRYTNDGNSVWAVASGVSIAMYGGIYELGRLNVKNRQVPDANKKQFDIFLDFASRKLQSKGMCHFIDVRTEIRNDSNARPLANLSDETLRRFVRNSFPNAKRSPNGYYRGLSIRKKQPQQLLSDFESSKIETSSSKSPSS